MTGLLAECVSYFAGLQAHEYERDQPGMRLGEFFDSVRGKWKTETGRQWADEIAKRRAGRQAGDPQSQSPSHSNEQQQKQQQQQEGEGEQA